ncbi:MAG: metallophosphoesterase [Ignavibacteriales bacterium]|nr:metallophosphoesterase [Ignavibacteriales bacterium]
MRSKFLALSILLSAFSFQTIGQDLIRFAVIGDFGWESKEAEDVANLVKSWKPDFVITTGDDNYDYGEDSTIDINIGQYYSEFISPYFGKFGKGDTINRFFPTLGNHDWRVAGAVPYLKYFTLPGNERYYDFVKGPVHFFALDSDQHEPDGNTDTSKQAQWLNERMNGSTSVWKIVYFHHAPYSSGKDHGNFPPAQWQYKEWGADAVLAGHEHLYERLMIDSLLYLVNGSGGRSLYTFANPIEGSQVRYCDDYGAQLVKASKDSITFQFYTRNDSLVDSYTLYNTKLSEITTPDDKMIPTAPPVDSTHSDPLKPKN